MENESTTGGIKDRKKGLPSTKEFLYNFLSNLLLKYLKWDKLLKDSEKLFVIERETNNSDENRQKKKLKLDQSNEDDGGGSLIDESKAIAVLDWRTSNGALTQDEKTRLHRDLKITMKNISGIDIMLTHLMEKRKINDDVIT